MIQKQSNGGERFSLALLWDCGEAGRAVERGCWTTCGTPVMTKLERLPEAIGLLAAGLEDPSRFKPAMDIFTEGAWTWDHMEPATQKLPQGLP